MGFVKQQVMNKLVVLTQVKRVTQLSKVPGKEYCPLATSRKWDLRELYRVLFHRDKRWSRCVVAQSVSTDKKSTSCAKTWTVYSNVSIRSELFIH